MVYMKVGAREPDANESHYRPLAARNYCINEQVNCYNLLQLILATSNHYAIMYLLTKENTMIIFYIAIIFSILLIVNFYGEF